MRKTSKAPHRSYQRRTVLIHGRMYSPHWRYEDHIVPPVSASVAYRLESAERGAEGFMEFANPEFNRHQHAPIYIYDRLDEPSRGMLEENLAAAEGGECATAFSTGMAAIAAALGVLSRTGDRILCHRTVYGCTYSLFVNWYPRYGIEVDFLDLRDPAVLVRALKDPRVMVVYFETPVNPTLDLIDLRAVRRAVDRANRRRAPRGEKRRRVFVVVDNTFATPFCQRPLSQGADIVIHSLTKNIGGFGTDMGGAVVGPQLLEPDLLLYRKDFGAPLSPKAAWPPLVYGLPTLALRAAEQQRAAVKIARHLSRHPAVSFVRYPGLASHPQHALARRQMRDFDGGFAPGTLVYFVVKGRPAEARARGARVINHIARKSLAITLAVSLGQIRTLIEHPSSMTHAPVPLEAQMQAGLDPGGLRLSVGLESPDDIIADLDEALG